MTWRRPVRPSRPFRSKSAKAQPDERRMTVSVMERFMEMMVGRMSPEKKRKRMLGFCDEMLAHLKKKFVN